MVPLWMWPMAIACGNTFVLKPSEKVSQCALREVELAHEAGLPAGVLNLVTGGPDVVNHLITHDDVRAVSFVGSTPVAKHIYSTASSDFSRDDGGQFASPKSTTFISLSGKTSRFK